MLPSLLAADTDPDTLAAALDAAPPAERRQAIEGLPGPAQARLFERSQGRSCTLARDFVPGRAADVPAIHWGRNSLPLFRLFSKRFALHASGVVQGYNEQAMRAFTGPGYFVAREAPLDGTPTVVIDYTRAPPATHPAGWPPARPNSARLGRFVYDGTEDWMWRVSSHVTIGRARRKSGWMDNWFVLCRED
jgi:hypothetical protein